MQCYEVEGYIFHLDGTFPDTGRAAAGIEEDQPYGENVSACLLVIAEYDLLKSCEKRKTNAVILEKNLLIK